jgi:hypothetical protein
MTTISDLKTGREALHNSVIKRMELYGHGDGIPMANWVIQPTTNTNYK